MAVSEGGGVFDTIIRMKDEASVVAAKFGERVNEALGGAAKKVEESAKKTEDATRKTEEFTETATIGWGKVGLAVGAATVAVGAFALKTLRSGIDAADQAGDTARRIGLSVEAYTRLTFAAQLSGVSQESLNTSLTTFARNASKAADDAGPLAKNFDALGISAQEFAALSPEEKLLRIADAIKSVPEGFDRARFATDLFGKSGASMVLLLEGGTTGLRELMQEADALGVTIGTNAARDAGRFNDALDRLSANFSKVRNEATRSVISGFAPLAEAFQKFVQNSGAIEAAANGIILVLKGVGLALNLVGDIFSFSGKIIAGWAAVIVSVIKGEFKDATNIAKALNADLAESAKRSKEVYESLLGINAERDKGAAKPGFKKSSFDAEGFGFVQTGFSGAGGSGTYSDVLPGAELRTRAREAADAEELDQLDAQQKKVEDRTQKHVLRLYNYDRSARQIRFQMGHQYDQMSLEASAFFFGQLGALMQTKSRALFEIGKAGAIAETIIQTYRAAQGAYAALASIPVVGPGLGAAAAAAAIAVGFARVQAIRSTSFGSANGSPVLSSGGYSGPVTEAGTPVAIPAPASLQGVAAPRDREINLYLSGEGSPTQSYIRDVLVPALNDALGDGAKLNVRTV
ncbi:tail tape measure-like protein [Microcystis phage Mae-JY22]